MSFVEVSTVNIDAATVNGLPAPGAGANGGVVTAATTLNDGHNLATAINTTAPINIYLTKVGRVVTMEMTGFVMSAAFATAASSFIQTSYALPAAYQPIDLSVNNLRFPLSVAQAGASAATYANTVASLVIEPAGIIQIAGGETNKGFTAVAALTVNAFSVSWISAA